MNISLTKSDDPAVINQRIHWLEQYHRDWEVEAMDDDGPPERILVKCWIREQFLIGIAVLKAKLKEITGG